jgi:hypothetical protein
VSADPRDLANAVRPSSKKEMCMDNVTLIRVVAGALAVLVLFVIIWRRKRKSIE